MTAGAGRAATTPVPASAARRRGGGARRPFCLALLAVSLLAGCAHRPSSLPRPAPESLPQGSPLRSATLSDADAWARHHLMFGEYDRALEILHDSPVAPSDSLVRALQEAVVLHHAGEHARSNAALERAEAEIDRRFTRSASRATASLLLNDAVMAYTPSTSEQAMIPYYRMLNYLALDQVEGALVEARKANSLLARLDRDDRERCGEDGLVQYLAGLVQRAGGEDADALVSLRRADRAFVACAGGAPSPLGDDLVRAALDLGLREVADSAASRYGIEEAETPRASGTLGDLVLVVEHGFVAHRSEGAVHVPILPDDVEGLDGEDEDGIVEVAARVSARLLQNLAERSAYGSAWDDEPRVQWAHALSGTYVMRLAWPVSRLEPAAPAWVRVWVDDAPATVVPVGDLSPLVRRDLEEARPAMVSRLVARGLAKYLVTREVEKQAEKEGGELAAFVLGRLTNLAANELERADTRSWSLLPGRISLVRARLPEGDHRVRIETRSAEGSPIEVVDLGTVRVRSGKLVVLHQRVWNAPRGAALPAAASVAPDPGPHPTGGGR